MIEVMDRSTNHLLDLLARAPVMGSFHPLLPLALPVDIVIADSAQVVAEAMDTLEPHEACPILINEYDVRYTDRFLVESSTGLPLVESVNVHLPKRIFTRMPIMRQADIAPRITRDTLLRGYQVVIVILVDGLSYDDTRQWKLDVEPCLVDGPSITFARTKSGQVAADVGFPRIVGNPPLARQLQTVGLRHSRGYTYWNREENEVTEYLFRGMPVQRVQSIGEAIETLHNERLQGLYIQIVREGTDGLAHRRREVRSAEVESTTATIHDDLQALARLLTEKELKGAVYLTSDHGMLWKQEHDFHLLSSEGAASPRYAFECPTEPDCATQIVAAERTYYLYHYPYIGRRVRSNDSGLHGGLSYDESVVPFVRLEVN